MEDFTLNLLFIGAGYLVRLNPPPSDCFVVEDAVSGVAAAKAAGARCLALTTSFTKEQLNGADYYAEDLSGADDKVLNW